MSARFSGVPRIKTGTHIGVPLPNGSKSGPHKGSPVAIKEFMQKFIAKVAFSQSTVKDIKIISRGRTAAPIKSCYLCSDNTVILPPDQFLWQKRVADAVVHVWKDGSLVAIDEQVTNSRRPKPGCMVITLESPHRVEYALPDFSPLLPLSDPGSRSHLSQFLPDLISDIGGLPDMTEVVLCNPVPYQASLDRIMNTGSGVQKSVRNAVWRALFRGGFRLDFLCRLCQYKPSVVINACTYDLRSEVTLALQEFCDLESFGTTTFFNCSHHPCMWLRKPSLSL